MTTPSLPFPHFLHHSHPLEFTPCFYSNSPFHLSLSILRTTSNVHPRTPYRHPTDVALKQHTSHPNPPVFTSYFFSGFTALQHHLLHLQTNTPTSLLLFFFPCSPEYHHETKSITSPIIYPLHNSHTPVSFFSLFTRHCSFTDTTSPHTRRDSNHNAVHTIHAGTHPPEEHIHSTPSQHFDSKTREGKLEHSRAFKPIPTQASTRTPRIRTHHQLFPTKTRNTH